MVKAEKEAQIFIRDAFIELGNGHPCTTREIFQKVAELRDHEISYDIIVENLYKMKDDGDGEIELNQVPRLRKNKKPFRNDAKQDQWKVKDFENFKKKHTKLRDNEYLQLILVTK